MTFGNRAPKKQKAVKKEYNDEAKLHRNSEKENKKNISQGSCIGNSNNSINSGIIINAGIKTKKQKDKKQKDKKFSASDFLKKSSKGNISNILLFKQTKEQKLELFIGNLKVSHPTMPDFWQQNEISKFKEKFNMG